MFNVHIQSKLSRANNRPSPVPLSGTGVSPLDCSLHMILTLYQLSADYFSCTLLSRAKQLNTTVFDIPKDNIHK